MGMSPLRPSIRAAMLVIVLWSAGCGGLREWWHNGWKVGPNYLRPSAAVQPQWLEDSEPHIRDAPVDRPDWWTVFDDPKLSRLIDTAHQQNLDLRAAGARVLQARAQRDLVAGNLFPQSQQALGAYAHAQLSKNLGLPLGPYVNLWASGFPVSWEIDFWGRYRRAIESANASLDAAADGYNDALILLLAETAETYVQLRVFQERLRFARRNVEIQRGSLKLAETRFKEGAASELDVRQARSSLAQTEALIPPLQTGLRQANNRLCLLLGTPPNDLLAELGDEFIPAAPTSVAAGIPAELLRRRPDVRRAERETAAQSAQIGVAKSDLYPRLALFGFLGYAADDFKDLFAMKSFTGLILPTFQWPILNYGRLSNNVRVQRARFQEKVLLYQQTVLKAAEEVENGLVAFSQAWEQVSHLEQSVKDSQAAVELVLVQYREGNVDFNRVYNLQAVLTTQQDQLAVARGNIALQLIAVYKALGGGWELFHDRASLPDGR
jgi:NodT family efflux transporter outer membrane factor (OMF) lipoprotein